MPSMIKSSTKQVTLNKQEKSHADWLAEQREAVKLHKQKQQAAWISRHQCTAGTSAGSEAPVQLGEVGFRDQSIGLVLLVNEAANHQWRQCAGLRSQVAEAGGAAAVTNFREMQAQKWDKLREAVIKKLAVHNESRASLMAGKNAEAAVAMNATSPKMVSKMLAARHMFQINVAKAKA